LIKNLKTNQMNHREHLFLVQLTDCCLCQFDVSIAMFQVLTSYNHS